MALVKIELPRKYYQIYFRSRNGTLIHRSSGIPHSPVAETPEKAKEKGKYNKLQAIALANDLEIAENGSSTIPYIKSLFAGALQRAVGIYERNGIRGVSVKRYLDSWLSLQTHLNESRKIYEGYIGSFCESLGEIGASDPLFQLDSQNVQEFIDDQLEKGLATTTINNKLRMLESAFAAALKRNLMLCNPIDDEDFLEEKRLLRKPFTLEQLRLLHQRWEDIGKMDSKAGTLAREWIIASKFAALQGMRLGDATQQVRSNIDFGDGLGFVVWTPEKTAHLQRVVTLPLHSVVYDQLVGMKNLPRDEKFTPNLAAIRRNELSTAFKLQMKEAGIDPEEYQLKHRVFSAYSFHSHKHFYVNTLEKALVPQDRRKLLSAHSSDSAHERYVHAWSRKEAEVLRPDIEKITWN